ncbi:chitin synthase chs-2-like isoform X1 [Haliotis rufescens]|uniref:chitin synthase chs-2-like isoform X1 n=2 Tax=Haliotis rufescens TaxID=6454 RepID=UPI00201F1B7E|nr:chitin synthase chs-2-like isoform X1 [Haliotis rufescens]
MMEEGLHGWSGRKMKRFNFSGRKCTYNVSSVTGSYTELAPMELSKTDSVPNGFVVDRPVALPGNLGDKDELIHAETETLSEGVDNPGFNEAMEGGANRQESANSDTSSDNIKFRNNEKEDVSLSETSESVLRRSVQGRSGKRDSYASLDSLDRKAPWRTWDVFRIISRDKDTSLDDATVNKLRKGVKVGVGMFLSLFVLVLTVISKSSLLLITSNIYVNVTLYCETYDDEHFTFCARAPPDRMNGTVFRPSQNVEIRWLWALFIVIVTPYLFTFIKCSWRACFKSTRNPTCKIILTVIIPETLHSVGICIFSFQVLPSLDALRGLVLMMGVAFLPAVLKLFDSQESKGRKFYVILIDFLCVIVQLSVLLLWPLRNYFFSDTFYHETWAIPTSLFLVSFGWWENYVNRYNRLGALGNKLRSLKRGIRRQRTKVYLIVSVWKIILTLSVMTVIMSDFNISCVKALYYLGHDGAHECPHLVNPYGIVNVEAVEYFQSPFWVMLIQTGCCLLCYTFAKTSCKILLQIGGFAIPLVLSMPILIGTLIADCETWKSNSTGSWIAALPSEMFWTCDIHGLSVNYLSKLMTDYWLPVAIAWWFSFIWITIHIWYPRVERLVQTERLFIQPLYCGLFLEQSLILNRRRDDKDREQKNIKKEGGLHIFQSVDGEETGNPLQTRGSLRTDITPMIYLCATMWHETEQEMVQMLTSVFRLDLDQCTRKHAYIFFDVYDPDYYEIEAHIFFDDAFEAHEDDENEFHVNNFVKNLVNVISTAASNVHKAQVKMDPPTKYPTPYGGRLEWTLPGQNKLVIHMKDKAKIRHKKRWSQVMYMYYLLGHRLVGQPLPDVRRKQTIADNTFILALDGDVDFKPSAVQLLVDRMKKNDKVGAACGRIHPIGTGPMVWYQKFEYAVSHWLQKATEHMTGCVLCSPGCFSLFRASALMDDNMMRKYTTLASEARHYVQYDQGEDRWLCTLLLQQGYRVEYCAAADALTYVPEGFEEFYNQRRRWSPSTMANIMDLLYEWRSIIKLNENVSALYMAYQLLLFVSSLLTPGTIFLLIVGAINTAFPELDLLDSLICNMVPIGIFLLVCFCCKSNVQLKVAGILSGLYALVMMLVTVGLALEMKREGYCAPTTIFMIFVVGVFIISAIMHPMELTCLLHGALYFMSIPSMSMLLMIYSICNLHVVSWGTREVMQPTQAEQAKKEQKKLKSGRFQSIINLFSNDDKVDSDYGFSFGNLFKCICCPRPKVDNTASKFGAVLEKLEQLETSMKNGLTSNPSSPTIQVTNEQGITYDLDTPAPSLQEQALQNNLNTEGVIRHNPLYEKEMHIHNDEYSPYWISDPEVGHGRTRYLGQEEIRFWKDLIERYLYPLQSSEEQKQKMQKDLIHLRNKMSLMFFILNALFVVIIFALQYTNAQSQGKGLAIQLPCKSESGTALTIEPFSLIFMAIFGIGLLIQFIAMFFHRMGTFLHIISSTEVNCMRLNQKEVAAMDISDKLELVKTMQSYGDDDDTRSVTSISSMDSLDDDSSMTTDDTPRPRRRKTVLRITKKRRKQQHNAGNLAQTFMDRYLKLADDLKNERVENTSHRRGSTKRRKKSIRKSQRAIKSVEQNKGIVLKKAQKWKHIAGIVRGSGMHTTINDHHHNDPWLSVVKGVLTQSRATSHASLHKVEEERRGIELGHRGRRPNTDGSKWSKLKDSLSGHLSAVTESDTSAKPENQHGTHGLEDTSNGSVVRVQIAVENDGSRKASKSSLEAPFQDHHEASLLDEAVGNTSYFNEEDSVKNLSVDARMCSISDNTDSDTGSVELEIKDNSESPTHATTSV